MRTPIFTILVSLLLVQLGLAQQVKVASFNPIAADLLRSIGKDKIKVVDIVKIGSPIHGYNPDSNDVRALESCSKAFAMGKNLEPYLSSVEDSLGRKDFVVEIGRSIPSQKVDSDPIYACCPAHSLGAIDPHWWHNVKNMERAAKIVGNELSKLSPENKSFFKQNAKNEAKRYRKLNNWVKAEVKKIPKEHRMLVTSHAAFAYFCKAYGFEAAFVQGLSKEGEISSKQLVETIKDIRSKRIKAIFPEHKNNPKVLSVIAKEAGCKLGSSLYADHLKTTYENMVRSNVTAITYALK